MTHLDQGVPHSGLDGNSKRSVYATAFSPTKRGFVGCGGQVTSISLDEFPVPRVVNGKTPAHYCARVSQENFTSQGARQPGVFGVHFVTTGGLPGGVGVLCLAINGIAIAGIATKIPITIAVFLLT